MNTIFRGMTRELLDLAYNNVKAEPVYAELMARYQATSSALYETWRVERDLRYGMGPRQRFDWFWCNQCNAPTFVFIHGGYWQNYAKEDLASVAVGALGRGFNVALAEYTLAPDASMTQIVEEIRALLDYLAVGVDLVGFGDRPVVICGHSAGGHLAALHRSHPAVDIAVAVSGLFDLEPISLSWLNDKLKLTAGETAAFSPLRHIGPGAVTLISVGSAELPELLRQSSDYLKACRAAGEAVTDLPMPGRAHFTILEDIATPHSAIMDAVVEAVQGMPKGTSR